MSGGGGKGGSQTQSVEIPEWLQQASQENLARARQVAAIDFMPWMGPTVAPLTPLQEAAMKNTGSAALSFGLETADPGAGMPVATEYAGGIRGYSDFPIYEQARQLYAEYDPANFAKRNALFSGAAPAASGGAAAPASASVGMPNVTDMERRMGLTPELKQRGYTVADFMGN